MDRSTRRHFANDYSEARSLFRNAAVAANATLHELEHPLKGPSSEALFMDVAVIGDPDASKVLVISSGVHGVEGFCGSACQVALMESGLAATSSVAVVLAHAVNPFGFAHLRRTNEDNVDLNRNFVAHPAKQVNAAYARLHPLLLPADWDGPEHLAADVALLTLMRERGVRSVYADAARGQYSHPDGMFFGGRSATWSNAAWRQVLAGCLKDRSTVVHLDLHTGLGPFGYGELLFIDARNTPGFGALRDWVSGPISPISEDVSVAPPVKGPVARAVCDAAMPGALVIPCALEFGTLSLFPVFRAMRADAWLNTRAADEELGRSLRAEVKAAFYVDDDAWRASVIEQALDRCQEILRGLAATTDRP